jgi:murein DD-endopeptidase MepM/ murein hydrolase activator NlpD
MGDFRFGLVLLWVTMILSGCKPVNTITDQALTLTPTSQTIIRTDPPVPTPSSAPDTITPTPTLVLQTVTPTAYKISLISSPLQGINRDELGSLITNPFEQPLPGSDGGHHGVDFAFYHFKEMDGIEGLPVLSILDGYVSSVLPDRYPYGNAIIIETPLNWMPEAWQKVLGAPVLTATPGTHISMTCPDNLMDPAWSGRAQSAYILYAHLQHPPTLTTGDQVTSGQAIALVGTTGGSVNPHLHVELRVGPSGVLFSSMSHYRGDTTEEERRNYCVWRVSGIFPLINPLILLTLPGNQ